MHFSGAIFASIFLAQGSFAIPTLNTLFARTPKDGPVLLQNWNAVADAYMKAVQPASIVKHNTWIETIPDACYTYATKAINASEPNLNRPHCPSINDLKVFEVWYSDSPKPWLFCRCSNSAFSEAELLDRVGRVPAAIRQRTRYIMSFKDGPTGIGGYALSSKDIVMFGTPGMTTWLHEMGHSFDENRIFSSADTYKNAMDKDTCWATPYAKKVNQGEKPTWTEPWAEAFIIQRLYKAAKNLMPVDVKCFMNQINAVSTQVNKIIDSGYDSSKVLPYDTKNWKRSNLPKRSIEAREERPDLEPVFATPVDFFEDTVAMIKRDAAPEPMPKSSEEEEEEFFTPADFFA